MAQMVQIEEENLTIYSNNHCDLVIYNPILPLKRVLALYNITV